MEAAERVTRDESFGSWRLWVGVMTGPLAWALQVIGHSNLAELTCTAGVRDKGEVWGVSVEVVIGGANLILILATVVAGGLAYRCHRQLRSEGDEGGRPLWMARVGVISSVLFGIALVLGVFPQLFLEVCEVGP